MKVIALAYPLILQYVVVYWKQASHKEYDGQMIFYYY